jgi:hypothetical protein
VVRVGTEHPVVLEKAGRGGPAFSFLLARHPGASCLPSFAHAADLPKLSNGKQKISMDLSGLILDGVDRLTRATGHVRLIGLGLRRFYWSGVSRNSHEDRTTPPGSIETLALGLLAPGRTHT